MTGRTMEACPACRGEVRYSPQSRRWWHVRPLGPRCSRGGTRPGATIVLVRPEYRRPR